MVNNSSQYLTKELSTKNERELLRAVLQAYINSSVNNLSSFETVILDRIMAWRVSRTTKTIKHFNLFFFNSFLAIVLLSGFGFINGYVEVAIIFFTSVVIGLILSFYMFLYFFGIVPIRTVSEIRGFKNAIKDLFFQTWSCIQLYYYLYLVGYIAVIFLLSNGTFDTLIYAIDTFIHKLGIFIYSKFGANISIMSLKTILYITLVSNIIYILTKFVYIVYYLYFKNIKIKKSKEV